MGCGGSKEDTSARDRSDAIEAQLKKDRLAMRSEIKMCVSTVYAVEVARLMGACASFRSVHCNSLPMQAAAGSRRVWKVYCAQADEAHP